MTQYRWAQASGGEIPSDAWKDGHGWEWGAGATEDDDPVRVPLWLARTLPDAGGPFAGSVRLGYVGRGAPAQIGGRWDGQPVDEYEVLLDEGTWREWLGNLLTLTGPAFYVSGSMPDAVVCGHTADGEKLYATGLWLEGEGVDPAELPANTETGGIPGAVLVDAALRPEPEPPRPFAKLYHVDLKGETVQIINYGDASLDLTGWRLRDASKSKPYIFPSGTVIAPMQSVVVISGPGAAKPAPGQLAWKTASVWNNRGDTAFLEDPAGEVVDTRRGW